MECTFIYENTKQIVRTINIIFHQKYHQYAQLYVICGIFIDNPRKIQINNLFTGEFIFSQNLTKTTKAIYFCNENFKINSNEILYLDSYTNKLLSEKIPEIPINSLRIHHKIYKIIKHIPKYLEISHQYMVNCKGIDILHKDIISHEFKDGIGYRKLSFQQIDIQYIKSLIKHMIFSRESIEITCYIYYESIRIGYIINIDNIKYRISSIYHDFLRKITTLTCNIYIEQISFNFCDSIKIESTVKQLNFMEITTQEIIENHYSISINPNIQYLFH
jgi:hypothetical protein